MRRFLPSVLGLTLLPTTALAHAVLVKAVPPQRTTLAASPPRVELWFNERLEPAYLRPSVAHEAWAPGDVPGFLASPAGAEPLSGSLPPLARGPRQCPAPLLRSRGPAPPLALLRLSL